MSVFKVAQVAHGGIGTGRHPREGMVMGRAQKRKTSGEIGLFSESSFPFTESRLESARRAVLDGKVSTDESGRQTWRDADCRGLSVVVNE